MIINSDHFTLANFEGTLDFLLCLIQKEEIDIYHVSIQELIQQFMLRFPEKENPELQAGAEFIGNAAYLVWLKSKMLLPHDEQDTEEEEKIEDPQFTIIHHLMDYCRFKQAAKDLTVRQEQQQSHYFRGVDEPPEWKKPLGIDHISLDELSQVFQQMMAKAIQTKPQIHEEEWRVSDKMRMIRQRLREENLFLLQELLLPEKSRAEIIVTFLAILELMKTGELAVGKQTSSLQLCIYAKQEEKVS
jgi:segregation and condensation protein A